MFKPRIVHRRSFGFTLIELMIVVAIIAIVLAMAIPSIRNARLAANESSAVSSLRSLYTAEQMHRTRFGNFTNVADLKTLGFAEAFDFYQSVNLSKAGYGFFFHTLSAGRWRIRANPLRAGSTGTRWFVIYDDGVIRYSTTRAAGISDPPID